jgi:hypothetical protein
MQALTPHPLSETELKAHIPTSEPVRIETFVGRVHVEWHPDAAVTPLGLLPFLNSCISMSVVYLIVW